MPYGLKKSLGGDSKRNDAKIKKQVNAIMASSHVSKVSAIKIAKAQMSKRAGKRRGR